MQRRHHYHYRHRHYYTTITISVTSTVTITVTTVISDDAKGGSRLLRTKNDTIFFFQRHIVLTDENMTAVTTTMSRETTTAGVGNLNDDRRAYRLMTGQPHIEMHGCMYKQNAIYSL